LFLVVGPPFFLFLEVSHKYVVTVIHTHVEHLSLTIIQSRSALEKSILQKTNEIDSLRVPHEHSKEFIEFILANECPSLAQETNP
jgi:hypothetical protein